MPRTIFMVGNSCSYLQYSTCLTKQPGKGAIFQQRNLLSRRQQQQQKELCICGRRQKQRKAKKKQDDAESVPTGPLASVSSEAGGDSAGAPHPTVTRVGQGLAPEASIGKEEKGRAAAGVGDGAADRDQVLSACLTTSLALAAVGLLGRLLAPNIAAEVPLSLLSSPDPSVLVQHLGVGVLTAAAVTAARLSLLALWPEFNQATNNSNRMALTNLAGTDLLQVSAFPAISEELLFRGLLLPLVGADWKGIAVAGVVFGVLHIPGGRNPAFAIWASAVGCAYGLIAVQTNDLATPMVAHALANYLSAFYWQSKNLPSVSD